MAFVECDQGASGHLRSSCGSTRAGALQEIVSLAAPFGASHPLPSAARPGPDVGTPRGTREDNIKTAMDKVRGSLTRYGQSVSSIT
jgi:hypothetical protein